MSADRADARPAIDQLLERLPGLSIVVGKGGVGKTTCAIGLAARLAARGERTLLVATDPAQSLGPALGIALSHGEVRHVEQMHGLSALQIDPIAARRTFLDRWRDVLITIIDRGTYLDAEDIGGLVDASMPGADEIFAILAIAELLAPARPPWDRLVVDTAPTGHTIRLLALPDTFTAMISLLDAMQAKHRFMVSALTRRYRRDAADDFLDEMRGMLDQLRAALGNPERAGAILVTRPEGLVVSETVRYADALRQLGMAIVGIVVEEIERTDAEAWMALRELASIGPPDILFTLPRIDPPPVGLADCAATLGRMVRGEGGIRRRKSTLPDEKRLRRGEKSGVISKSGGDPRPGLGDRNRAKRFLRDIQRTLVIVGGKGGVGKTTVSCALAISSALDDPNRTRDVLLVSTDPAPSIGDAFGITDSHWATVSPEPVDGVLGLHAWQMDAAAAFRELRDRYRERIDHFFDALTGGSIDLAHDRTILRDLLALAPPGIDELYALASLGEALEQGGYERIVVDPAPTGHLLRLIELPALALDWSHRLMRLIMKYREVSGLVEAAQDLVNFSRRTRGLERLLHDYTKAGVVVVSLDEPVVIGETTRLAAALTATGISIPCFVRNRVRPEAGTVLSTPVPVIVAPESDPPPVGVAAIRDWCERWQLQD